MRECFGDGFAVGVGGGVARNAIQAVRADRHRPRLAAAPRRPAFAGLGRQRRRCPWESETGTKNIWMHHNIQPEYRCIMLA